MTGKMIGSRRSLLLPLLAIVLSEACAWPLAAQPEPARGIPPGVTVFFDQPLPGKAAGGPAFAAAVAPEGDAARGKPEARFTGPWDLEALKRPPRMDIFLGFRPLIGYR